MTGVQSAMIAGRLRASHAITSEPPPSASIPSPIPRSTDGRSGTTASGPASPTPITDAELKTPPFAYQSTATDGTDPDSGSNLPSRRKCGSAPTSILGMVRRIDDTVALMSAQAADTAEAAAEELLAELAKSEKEDCPAVAIDCAAIFVWSRPLRASSVAASTADPIEPTELDAEEHAPAKASIAGVPASSPGTAAAAAAARAATPPAAPGAESATVGSADPIASKPPAASSTEAAMTVMPAARAPTPTARAAMPTARTRTPALRTSVAAAAATTPTASAESPTAAASEPAPSASIPAPSAAMPTAADAP